MKVFSRTVPIVIAVALAVSSCSSAVTEPSADAAVATIEAPATITAGALTYCTPFESPPNNFYDENHNEVGAEVDLARVFAEKMGLTPEFRETKFASIIPTLQAGQCDVIMASLYIKPEREEIVDFVPYMISGQAVAVTVGNPKNVFSAPQHPRSIEFFSKIL
jgi:polar amino acid transport system substrate-binding protein